MDIPARSGAPHLVIGKQMVMILRATCTAVTMVTP